MPDATSDTTSNASTLLNIESLIKSYLAKLETLKASLKEQKGIFDNSFESDTVYHENAEKAKEAAMVKNSTKQQILKEPTLMELSEKIDDLRLEIKDAEETLSDYLIQYQKETGFNQIETDNGETMIIVNKARLVKGSK